MDSGSPYNFVPLPLARRLGVELDLDRWEPIQLGGGTVRAVMAGVTMTVPNFDPIQVVVGFVSEWKWPWSIVGQRGFFDLFVVTFDRPSGKFALEQPRRDPWSGLP